MISFLDLKNTKSAIAYIVSSLYFLRFSSKAINCLLCCASTACRFCCCFCICFCIETSEHSLHCCCLIASSCLVAVTSISLFLIASSSFLNCLSFLYFSVRCSTALACSFLICPLLPSQRRHRSFPLAAIDFKAFCRKSSARCPLPPSFQRLGIAFLLCNFYAL